MSKFKVLITGIAGFIGHHLTEHILKHTNWDVIGIDKLTYASVGLTRLKENEHYNSKRLTIYTWDLSQELSIGIKQDIGDVNYIIHLCAETHVDNSIENPVYTIHNNVMSTVYMLEYARELKTLSKFIYFSTDEVYGTASEHQSFTETDVHNPSNPYSASKSASESICLSYINTYRVPILMINAMNVFGERQHEEKFIPKTIKNILNDNIVRIHCDTNRVIGSRFYIYVDDISSVVLFLLDKGLVREKYNISGSVEINNLEVANMISCILNKPFTYELLENDDKRPGHDLRYCLNDTKIRALGWNNKCDVKENMIKVVEYERGRK